MRSSDHCVAVPLVVPLVLPLAAPPLDVPLPLDGPAPAAALLAFAAAAGAAVTALVVTVAVGVTSGCDAVAFVSPPLAAGGDATGAIGVVDSGAAGFDGKMTAVVPAPDAEPAALADAGGTLGASAPPDALMVSVALGVPGQGGHAGDSGIAPAGSTPAVLVDAPAADVAPVADGTPRMAPVPLVCARAPTLQDPHATNTASPRSVIACGVCTRRSTLRLLTRPRCKACVKLGPAPDRASSYGSEKDDADVGGRRRDAV